MTDAQPLKSVLEPIARRTRDGIAGHSKCITARGGGISESEDPRFVTMPEVEIAFANPEEKRRVLEAISEYLDMSVRPVAEKREPIWRSGSPSIAPEVVLIQGDAAVMLKTFLEEHKIPCGWEASRSGSFGDEDMPIRPETPRYAITELTPEDDIRIYGSGGRHNGELVVSASNRIIKGIAEWARHLSVDFTIQEPRKDRGHEAPERMTLKIFSDNLARVREAIEKEGYPVPGLLAGLHPQQQPQAIRKL